MCQQLDHKLENDYSGQLPKSIFRPIHREFQRLKTRIKAIPYMSEESGDSYKSATAICAKQWPLNFKTVKAVNRKSQTSSKYFPQNKGK